MCSGEPLEPIALGSFASNQEARLREVVVHQRPGLNERGVPLLRLKAANRRHHWGVTWDAELLAHDVAARRFIEAFQIHAVVDPADGGAVAVLRHDLAHHRIAHGDQPVNTRRELLQ